MSANKNVLSLHTGELQTVSVADLESHLSALWQSAAEHPDTEHPVTRASVLTLLVYVESEKAGAETLDVISKVMYQNPCRAIVMIADREAKTDGVTASISARCLLPTTGEKQVCCEEIGIRARGEAVSGLDSVVVPLTIPGLPVYLWWRANRFEPPDFLHNVFRRTDRIFVDSARFTAPAADLKNLARHIQNFSGIHSVAFSDLNWCRLTPWRELISQFFDPAERRLFLSEICEIAIQWRHPLKGQPNKDRAAQALLLAGWFAGRMGWKPASALTRTHGRQEVVFETGERTVRLELRRGPEDDPQETPFCVQIKAGKNSPASFQFQELSEGGKIVASSEIARCERYERTITLPPADEVHLVHEELRFPNRDVVYEEALGIVARIAGL